MLNIDLFPIKLVATKMCSVLCFFLRTSPSFYWINHNKLNLKLAKTNTMTPKFNWIYLAVWILAKMPKYRKEIHVVCSRFYFCVCIIYACKRFFGFSMQIAEKCQVILNIQLNLQPSMPFYQSDKDAQVTEFNRFLVLSDWENKTNYS